MDEDDGNIQVDISRVARLRKLRKSEQEAQIKGDEYQKRLKEFYENQLMQFNFYKWGQSTASSGQLEGESQQPEDQARLFADQINDAADLKELLSQQISWGDEQQAAGELPQNIVDIDRIGIVPAKDKHDAVIQSLDFHSNSQVFLSSGLDKLIKIYTVQENKTQFREKVKVMKSVYLEGLPITCCRFISQQQILAAGFKKHLISYDLVSDKLEKISSYLFTQRFSKKLD